MPSIEKTEKYFYSNVVSTFKLLNNINISKVKKFVYLASSTCTNSKKYPTNEKKKINVNILMPYKNIGEQLVTHWANVYKLKAITLRLFNVYGGKIKNFRNIWCCFGVFFNQVKNFSSYCCW